jgi:CRISPR-associated protein Cst2
MHYLKKEKRGESKQMGKIVQISILGKISGNVNADEVIGTRITLKKMYSSSGEVLPFVSARAIKYAIRQAFKENGYEIDPFIENPEAIEALRLSDTGKPEKYIDNDVFGYMVTRGRGKTARKRQAPVGLSYFKALKDTAIKTEFAARFPRSGEENPVPFEVEVAEFIGKLNCVIYDYIGKFKKEEIDDETKKVLEAIEGTVYKLSDSEREKRIKTFLKILLTPSYILPRRTNSLCIPEYIAALIILSSKGALPIFQYLNYDFTLNKVDVESLKVLLEREEIVKNNPKILLIDYFNKIEPIEKIEKTSISKAIDDVASFLRE